MIDDGVLCKDVRVAKGSSGVAALDITDRSVEPSLLRLNCDERGIVSTISEMRMEGHNTCLEWLSAPGVVSHEADGLVEVRTDMIPTQGGEREPDAEVEGPEAC